MSTTPFTTAARRAASRPEGPPPPIRGRLAALDWEALEASLQDHGYARTAALLTPAECAALAGTFQAQGIFRSRVSMERHAFGRGDYAYFGTPLPPLVRDLREHGYRHLAPIANRWAEALGEEQRYPARLEAYLARCRGAGQSLPTPLLLRYGEGGYNRLHQDRYGALQFPLQLTCFLSRPGLDYEGGAFLLLEHQARLQSRGEALLPAQGELVIFPAGAYPVAGRRGWRRAHMRHGVATVTRGERCTLGIIFHDAA
jgi:hypothetical protein